MRAKEFIVEYKRDITAANFNQQLVSRVEKDPSMNMYAGLSAEDIPTQTTIVQGVLENYFEKADPTPNKQYIMWMLRMYISGEIKRLEDVFVVGQSLEKYHEAKIRKLLPVHMRDINQYKSIAKFYTEVGQLHLPEKELTDKGSANVFYEDGAVRIIHPENEAASCYYGQGTKWCTAGKNHNMFDYYNASGPMYIILPKVPNYAGEKYQVHFQSNQFMDEMDEEVYPEDLVDRFPTLTKAFAVEAINNLHGAFMPTQIKKKAKDLLASEMISAQEDIIVSYDRLDPDSALEASDSFQSMMDSEEMRIREDLQENDDFMEGIKFEMMQFQKTAQSLFVYSGYELGDTFIEYMKRKLPKIKERLLASL